MEIHGTSRNLAAASSGKLKKIAPAGGDGHGREQRPNVFVGLCHKDLLMQALMLRPRRLGGFSLGLSQGYRGLPSGTTQRLAWQPSDTIISSHDCKSIGPCSSARPVPLQEDQ